MRHVLHARVTVAYLHREAHVALGAVEKLIPAANSANPAAIAMVLPPVLVIEEVALEAGVLAESTMAVLAGRLNRLTCVAEDAYQFGYFLPIDRVTLAYVVAEPTRVYLIAARCHELALSLVVITAVLVFRGGRRRGIFVRDVALWVSLGGGIPPARFSLAVVFRVGRTAPLLLVIFHRRYEFQLAS